MPKQQGPLPAAAGSRPKAQSNPKFFVSPNHKNAKRPPQLLPRIQCNHRQLRDMTSDSLEALQSGNNPPRLFVRDRRMVTVIRNHEGRNMICNVTEPMLRGELTRSADFFKLKRGRDGEEELIPCPPSYDVVKDIHALPPTEWKFLPLQGVIETPCLR